MAETGKAGPEVILVADDIPANVELLLDQLNSLGYETITATDGPSAVAAAFEKNPDLCILDVSMPAGDLGVDDRSTGFEVCRRIKRDPRTSRIPVIFVTALNDTSDRVRGIEAGGDDFLTKPHNRLVLGARVRSLLKLKAATDALEDSLRKLRELEKVRDDLMKMIVHDLKTPLTSVLATLEMLADGDFGAVTTPQKAAIGDAETKSEDLLALIDDILEVARIEETDISLALAPIAPGALLAELVHEWDHRFQQEGTTSSVSVADDAPVFSGDKGLDQASVLEPDSERRHALFARGSPGPQRAPRAAGSPVHRDGQWAGNSIRVPRPDLSEVRPGRDAALSANAQLGARTHVLQAGGGAPRRANLAEERGRPGELFLYRASIGSDRHELRLKTIFDPCSSLLVPPSTSRPTVAR